MDKIKRFRFKRGGEQRFKVSDENTGIKRSFHFDFIRIVSMLMVLAVHSGQRSYSYNPYTSIGQKGVYLFFIISGYFGIQSYDKLKKKGAGAKEYYINRIKRIVPLYYTVLVLLYVYDIYKYLRVEQMPIEDVFGKSGPCGIQYLRYFLFLQYVLPSNNFALWNNRYALWTMSSFAFFYFILPLLYKFFNGKYKIVLLAVISIVINIMGKELMTPFYSNYSGGFMVVDGMPLFTCMYFVLGMVVWKVKGTAMSCTMGIIALFSVVFLQMQWNGYELIFFAICIFASAIEEFSLKPLIGKIIIWLSNGSFAVYLCHPVLFDIFGRMFIAKYPMSDSMIFWSLMFIGFSGGYIFYFFFEKISACILRIKQHKG